MSGSISSRNQTAIRSMEHQAIRARLHSGPSVLEFLSDDCVFMSPTYGILSASTEPSLHSRLEKDELPRFTSYEMRDEIVVEVSMMSATICYRVIWNPDGEGGYSALCTSTWKQLASSKWKLCAHLEAPEE